VLRPMRCSRQCTALLFSYMHSRACYQALTCARLKFLRDQGGLYRANSWTLTDYLMLSIGHRQRHSVCLHVYISARALGHFLMVKLMGLVLRAGLVVSIGVSSALFTTCRRTRGAGRQSVYVCIYLHVRYTISLFVLYSLPFKACWG